ncbi:MAG: hypothetical protein JWM57_638 [Phycisphaerales bacterium]|nr:hypothetical protein [Phycisphaerales bacterium]
MSEVASPSAPAPPAAASPVQRPKRRRRAFKLILTFLIAIAIVIISVLVFFDSDRPRQMAINIAQNVTGLRVEIGKLEIDAGGHSGLSDLRVSLPLAKQPFLTARRIEFWHRPLVGILFTLNPNVWHVEVSDAHLDARQNTDKSWNLQQVLNQLAAPGKNAASSSTPPLPVVKLYNASTTITFADGRAADFKGIEVSGAPINALAYRFGGDFAGLSNIEGELSASGRWPHRANVTIKPALLKALEPLTGVIPTVASAQLNWQGERTATGLTGRLTIPEKTTQFGPLLASGAAKLTLDNSGANGSTITAEPEDFTITPPGLPAVTLAGGSARLVGTQLTLAGMRARFADGTARLDGSADIAAERGNIVASWEQVAFPAGITHEGKLTLELANIWPGRPWVKGDLQLAGDAAGGHFETQANIAGDGASWTNATYVINLPVLRYARQSELRLQDLQATLHNTADAVELSNVRVRQSAAGTATLDADGVYHFAGQQSGNGFLTAIGKGFAFGGEHNLDFTVNAWADKDSITLQNAYANLGTDGWANLTGQYTFGRPEPIAAQLDLDTDRNLSLTLSNAMKVGGHVSGSMKVGGTLTPTRVTIVGQLASRNLKVDQYKIGDADLLVSGSLLADRADVRTERLDAFGGQGWFGADFPYFGDVIHAWMGFEKINLADIGTAVGNSSLGGTAAGEFDVHVPVGELDRAYGTGNVTVDHPTAKPALMATEVAMPVHIGDGYVRVSPRATQEAGGTAAIVALVSLNDPGKFKLNVNLKDWLTQLPMEEFSVLTGGKIDLPQVEIGAQSANGSVDVVNQFFAHDKPIGNIRVRASASGRHVKLERLGGELLGGQVEGQGSINFDDLSQGKMIASIDGMSLDRLAQIDPRLTGVQGGLSLSLHSHASDVPHPLGPVQADLVIDSDRATYKGIEIGDSRVRVFADRSRVAMADDPKDPNVIAIAGGTVRLWGRVGQVSAVSGDGVARTSAFVSAHLDQLDTEQLNKMIDPDGRPVPGRLSGDITAFGNAADVKRLSGQGHLKLTDSDLGNIGLFAVLYNAMHLGLVPSTPTGYGDVNFRLTMGKLEVTGLNYFNRGVYAKGAVTLGNVLNLKNSPVSGYVLGTFRPLKDLKLPFFGTIDSILDALQSSATTLRIEGTMKAIQATPVSLKAVSGSLKNILVGEAQAK